MLVITLGGNFYRPQTKFAKVMFLQVSVCPHRGGCAWFYSGGMRGFIQGVRGFIRGVHGFIWGACVVLFGGCAWFYSGGLCVVLFGGRAWFYSGACVVLFGGRAWFFQFFRIQSDTVNERAVRILLECILVYLNVLYNMI